MQEDAEKQGDTFNKPSPAILALAHLIPDQGGFVGEDTRVREKLVIKSLLDFQPDPKCRSHHEIIKLVAQRKYQKKSALCDPRVILHQNLRRCLRSIDKDNEVEMVNKILFNEPSHIVAIFKEYLIYDDCNEFLHRFYRSHETPERMNLISNYYQKKVPPRPWLETLPHIKIFNKASLRKEKIRRIREEDNYAFNEINRRMNTKFFKSTFMRSIEKDGISVSPSQESKINEKSFLDLLADSTINDEVKCAVVPPKAVPKIEPKSAFHRINNENLLKILESKRCISTRAGSSTRNNPYTETPQIKTIRLRQSSSVGRLGTKPAHPQRKLVVPRKQNEIPQIVPAVAKNIEQRFHTLNSALNLKEKLRQVYGTTKKINKLHQKHAKSADNKQSKVSLQGTGCKVRNIRALKESQKKATQTKGILLQKPEKVVEAFKVHFVGQGATKGYHSARKLL